MCTDTPFGSFAQVREAHVGRICAAQLERAHFAQMRESGVTYTGEVQVECARVRQVRESFVGDCREP